MSYGRYFEEFTVGDVYKHWPGRTITEHDDTWFSLMTMNQNPLHIDEHYAAGTQHGRRLVNGTFIFSLAVGMSVADASQIWNTNTSGTWRRPFTATRSTPRPKCSKNANRRANPTAASYMSKHARATSAARRCWSFAAAC